MAEELPTRLGLHIQTRHEHSNREREIRICTMAQEKRYPNQDITRFKRL
jgi:hypothetical protein